jgi:DNA repair protein RecO (recombination protein O)
MEYKYTGIVLNKRDVGETDRIYTMYTLEGGKVRSLAKGVRKAHAKLASSLENFTLADITIVRTKGLGKITGSIVEQNFSSLKKNCDALMHVFSDMAIFEKMVDLDHQDRAVFVLLREYFQTMDSQAEKENASGCEIISLGFIVKLLDMLGYAIEVDLCVVCGCKLSQHSICFSPEHGGALCQDCAQKVSASCWIKPNSIKLIRLFLKNNLASLFKIKANKEDCDNARIAIEDFVRWNA